MIFSLAMAREVEKNKSGPLPSDFSAIYEEYSRSIYYFVLRYLGDPALAEDATHDVFIKAFKAIDRFRGDASIRTWLYRIAVNHCKNLRQSWHNRKIQYESELAEHLFTTASDSPLRAIETSELGSRIQDALDNLPNEYAMLLLMVADQRMSYEQIASLTNQSADAVRGKLYRARKAFATAFHRDSEDSTGQ